MEERTIFKALSAVQADLAKQGIGKTDENTFDRYKYRGIDSVLNVLGPILAKHGVLIVPSTTKRETRQVQSRKGETMNHSVLEVKYTFYDAHGDSITHKAYGEAIDRGDKSLNKALTSAFKYLIFQAFAIPLVGDDADAESHDLVERGKKPARKAPAKKAPAKEPESKPLTPTQVKAVSKLVTDTGSDLKKMLDWVGVQSVGQITQKDYERVMGALKAKPVAA